MERRRSPIASPLTADGSIVGTIQHMAPEQIEGKEADARSDIFAFGAMLHEMSRDKRPFILEDQPPPVRSLQPLLPVVLERLIETCLRLQRVVRAQG